MCPYTEGSQPQAFLHFSFSGPVCHLVIPTYYHSCILFPCAESTAVAGFCLFVCLEQSLLQPGVISSSLWLKAGLELSTVLSTFIPSAGMTSVCCMISFSVFLLVSQCDDYPWLSIRLHLEWTKTKEARYTCEGFSSQFNHLGWEDLA